MCCRTTYGVFNKSVENEFLNSLIESTKKHISLQRILNLNILISQISSQLCDWNPQIICGISKVFWSTHNCINSINLQYLNQYFSMSYLYHLTRSLFFQSNEIEFLLNSLQCWIPLHGIFVEFLTKNWNLFYHVIENHAKLVVFREIFEVSMVVSTPFMSNA